MLPMPRALLLDFDGLICDTESAGHRAWRELYAEHGLAFPVTLWRAMVGRSDGEQLAIRHLAKHLPGTDVSELAEWRKRRKHALCDDEPLRPGVRTLLERADRANTPVAVVSSAPRSWVEPHLQRLGVHHLFTLLATGELTDRHKPDPTLYRIAVSCLGARPGDTVAFEDSVVGIRAARAAGVRCVAVPNAVGDPALLAGADTVLTSLTGYDLTAGSDV